MRDDAMSYTRCRHSIILIATILLSACAATDSRSADLKKISAREARELLNEGLRAWCPGCDLKEIAIESIKMKYDANFYYYHATWSNPTGSPNLGNFAVNPWTGNVWDGCVAINSPALKELQDRIQKRFSLSEKDYSLLRSRKPVWCVDKKPSASALVVSEFREQS
jgi:hypothetical protein